MFDIPAFFIDHRIEQDADERMIKRAYAKALKQIDQDNDLEGFQNLREEYERALAWVRSKEWREQYIAEQNAESEQSTELGSTQEHMNSEPNAATFAMGDAVAGARGYTENTASPELVPQQPTSNAVENAEEQVVYAIDIARHIFLECLQHLGEKAEEVGQTEFLLRMYLDDERLINVEIRDLFEWLIAERLAQGWQTGNGDMFGAAVKCFGWHQDKHRLLRFHDFGYYLDRAVDEMSAFNLQDEARTYRQVGLIRLARNDAPPTKQFLRENIYFIDEMLSSYPTWLAMVTKYENLQTWHKRAVEYKFFQPPKLNFVTIREFFKNSEWSAPLVVLIVVVLMVLSVVSNLGSAGKTIEVKLDKAEFRSNTEIALDLYLKGERYLNSVDSAPADIALAEINWKRAAALGSHAAQLGLVKLYEDDRYGRKNIEESKRYAKMAASRNE